MHVRFFEGPSEAGINNAPGTYYDRAVALMETLTPKAHYFVFSDQPEAARVCIPLSDERITLVMQNQSDKNAYADLWLMTQCQHFIIANSTFSWWGAWLAANTNKQVIAPRFVINTGKTAWNFTGQLPQEWHKI